MKTNIDIRKWLLPLVVLLAAACGHDDLVPPDVYVEESTPYVEIRIAVPLANPASTRANPMGGEEGNGRERGLENEDKIHDINVFLYAEEKDGSGVGKGMDSKDDTKILKHIYYNLDNHNDPQNSHLWTPAYDGDPNYDDEQYKPYYEKGYVVIKFQCEKEFLDRISNDGINFLAVANTAAMQSMEGKSLKELRELDLTYYSQSWTPSLDAGSVNASKMDYFLMSTAYNENVNGTGDNKIRKSGTEYKGTTTLQRLYSRLDLSYEANVNVVENDGKVIELKYAVGDKTSVYITNALAVNVMQQPSFVFKKVTNFSVSNNWISSDFSGATDFSWGGKESPNDLPTATAGSDKPLNYVVERHTLQKGPNGVGGDIELWYGNTRTSQVKSDITDAGKGKLSAYYQGVPPSATNSYERIAVISYANENTHPTDCFHSNYLTGMAFRAVYVPDKIYKTAAASDDEVVSSSETIDKIYRYSPTASTKDESKSKYFSNKDAADAYAKAHPEDMAIVSKESDAFKAVKHGEQWGFICYYNLWLRHYNDVDDVKSDPHEHLPMEYATVRNNIYRVSVSFSGPGDPTPTMREPDTMKARIFVRKWNYREEGTLDFNFD